MDMQKTAQKFHKSLKQDILCKIYAVFCHKFCKSVSANPLVERVTEKTKNGATVSTYYMQTKNFSRVKIVILGCENCDVKVYNL